MKKSIIAAGLLALFSTTAMANETLIVGATPVPHAEILEFVKPVLAKEGVDLQIKVFNDFIQPNQQLAEKHLDANYYQYRPFLDNYNQTRHTNLVPVVGVHIEPFGAYSSKYTSLTAVPDGATIAIPNDPVNTGRALVMLSNAGLITLKDPHNPQSATKDITSNPHHFKIRELEGAMLARAVSAPAIAMWADSFRLRRTPLALMGLAAALAYGLLAAPFGLAWWFGVWFVASTLVSTMVPLTDVIVFRRAGLDGFNYGFARGIGHTKV